MTFVLSPPPKKKKIVSIWERLKLIVQPRRMQRMIERERSFRETLKLSAVEKDGEAIVVMEGPVYTAVEIEGDVWVKGLDMQGSSFTVNGCFYTVDPNNPNPGSWEIADLGKSTITLSSNTWTGKVSPAIDDIDNWEDA